VGSLTNPITPNFFLAFAGRVGKNHLRTKDSPNQRPELHGTTTVSLERPSNQWLDAGTPRWRAYLLLLVRSHPAARPGGLVEPSDIVQDALAEAIRQRGRFRGTTDGEYAVWLRRILFGRLTDAIRAARRSKRDAARVQSLDAAVAESSGRWALALAADQSSPSQRAMRDENLVRLAEALALLPAAQREAVILRHALGWPLDRIAAQLERTPAATAGLLKRGLRQLRTTLDTPEVGS
jgi:RNA polymerase sigma-70 factor (ECF subfamily)